MNHEIFTTSWRYWPSPWAEIAMALVACLCGAIIGSERERHEKPAGLRTLILVCLGSAVFTMASYLFETTTRDNGRIAAQVVTGIGFLGAGVILHGRTTISGTTTAATIWVTAGAGMIAGTGHAMAALGLSLLVRALIVGVHCYEVHAMGGLQQQVVEIDFAPSAGRTRVKLAHVLADFNALGSVVAWQTGDPATHTLVLRLRLPQKRLRDLGYEIVSLPEVLAIREADGPEPS